MSLQAIFDKQLIDKLSLIKNIIDTHHDDFCINQIRVLTLKEALNTIKPIYKMSDTELEDFQNTLIEQFKNNGWVK